MGVNFISLIEQYIHHPTHNILYNDFVHISKYFFEVAKTPLGDMLVGIAFGRLSGLLPVKRIFENDKILVFWHPKPFWEQHILIVPKKQIKGILDINEGNEIYILEMYKAAKYTVEKLNWSDKEYSMLTNGGKRQEVNQLHMHLFCGSEL